MRLKKIHFILIILLVLLLGVANVCAADVEDVNSTQTTIDSSISIDNDYQLEDNSPIQLSDDSPQISVNEDNQVSSGESDEIEVETWEDIQYYSSLTDKNYVLKLKENTNYYPASVTTTDSQVVFRNNVTIIGAEGAYIGDSSPNARNITYTAMLVPDNSGVGINFQGVTFKWIGTRYQPDGVFLQMGGNAVNYFTDCYITNCSVNLGHSSILYIKLGDAIIDNCTFINCTTDFGCLSVYNPDDDPTKTCTKARMNVTDSYFEGNYARTEPGCINNCGILVVNNSTFHNNSAFWWAGAIHTHGGANTTLYDCNFTDNVAGWNGGALYTYSYLQIYRCIFLGNNCTTNNGGGAIGACKYLHAPYIYIEDSLFENNENTCWGVDELSDGTGRGGAISIMDQGALEVRNTTFIKNSASMGTAICAINGGLQMGSPDIIIVGNRFINHTRVGDVLDIRLATGSYCEIRDNYYYNNSFEYKKLRLLAGDKIGNEYVVNIDAELTNPNSFESDILDTTDYDVYVDGVYNRTVTGRTFTLHLEDGETCNVYVVPCISDSVSNQILVGAPKEYIYVSQQSGKNTNDGLTRSTPVKTIAKAIQLARTKGNIIIMDGTFSESNLTIDYNLSITGENNVKFTGNIPINVQTIFTVTNYSDLSIKGITFDNIVFTANTTYKNKRVILQDTGYLTIEDCTFSRISPSGNTAMNLIESPNVEVYNSIFTNNNKASVYVVLIKSNEFLIDNCTFTNNIASYSSAAALISTVSTKTGVKGTVTNSLFENNKVKYGCIYFGSSGKPLTVTNTKFIANTVGGTSDHASCIKVEESTTLRVDSVVFKDNINLGTRAAVIYCSGSSGSIFVTNSIVVNNSYSNNNHFVFSASTANNLKAYKNLNGNWWGHTLENYTVAPAVYAAACNNWVILNTTANVTTLGTNQNALVFFDLNNAYDEEFNESFYDAKNLPSFDLDIKTTGGISNVNKVSVEKGRGSVIYTLQSTDVGSLTASYATVESIINFTWSIVDPEISIDVDDITYGENAVINLTLPSDISLSDISLTLNENNLNAQNVITLSDLNAGDYVLNLTYPGNSKYNPFNLAKTFTVNKADPQLTVNVPSEVYYGNQVRVEVNALADVEGTVTVNAGNATASGTLSNGRRVFSLSGFEANNYTVVATYPGNDNYLSGNATASFVVKKYNSTLSISNGTVQLGKNVVLTFNLNSDADGTITVVVDGNAQTVNVENGQATYTINKITRGLHNIEATYNGNAKYLPSNASIQLDVARYNPNLAISVSDISFGQDAIVQISLANAATGSVTVTIDGKTQTVEVEDGEAVAAISGISVGNNKVVEVNYSGNTLYAPSYKTANFNVVKGESVITISAPNIKEGQVATIQITLSKDATGTLVLNYVGISENVNIPRSGVITRTLSDLAIGTYSVSASYAGDSNYLSSSATKSFNVEEWVDAQWPNEGYDVQNSAKSPYSSNANGYVKWNVTINGNVTGNMVIDSNGYIYILTDNGIYSYTYAGRLKWNFNSQDAGTNFSGIAVGRDVVISPKSGDKLYFINQTTGQKYSNNMYQGSSIFVPVIDEDANIYISSEYQYSESCYNLVIVPYNIWQTSTAPTLISLGQHEPTTAPVITNNGFVAIGSEDGLIIVDLSSESIIGIFDDVITNQRPVIGSDGLIYTIDSGNNLLMAVDPVEGVQWVAEINGTPGDNLVVNGDYVYSVTKEGVLYQYYYGEESLVYNFTENITSNILMGNNGALYIGSESGTLYAINLTGSLLWKVNLDGPISGSPVMDKNGVIYLIAGDKLYAISSSRLIDPNLSATASNAVYGEDVVIDVELDSSATGRVSVTIGNEIYDEEVKDGKVSFSISDLRAGSYTARIYYSGDSRFKQKSMNVPFTVGKADVTLVTNDKNINAGETLRFTVSNFTNYATGTVTLSVGGKTNTATVINGQATLAVSGLAKGHYNYVITYSGDNNYNAATISKSVSVGYEATSFTATTSAITVGQTAVVTVSGLPSDASGVTYIMLNGQNYSATVSNGGSTISIPNLLSGTYRLDVRYTNDAKYMANPKVISLKVKKVNPSMSITARDISVGSDLAVTVTLNNDASGSVAISVGGVTNNVTVTNGVASTSFAGLSYGSYVVNVSYSGDDKYNPRVADNKVVNVNKVTPSMTISANKYSLKVGETFDVSATLNSDVTGDVVFTVGDDSKTVAVNNGVASASFSGLKAGTYTLNVSYSGDDKYNPRFVDSKTVTVTKYDISMSVAPIDLIYVGENLTITVNNLPSDGAPFAYIMGDLSGQTEIKNGAATFIIPDLAAGEYTFNVYYPGNDKYNENTISNLKATVKDKEDIIIRSSNIVMEYGGRTDYVVEVSDYEGNKLENAIIKIELNGNTYNRRTNANGTATVLVYLDVGKYDVNVSFAGNRTHNKAFVSNTITITLTSTTLTAEDVSMEYSDGTTYDVKLTDSKNKAISNALIKVTTPKGVSEYTTDNKGMVSVPLDNINPGTYSISAVYEGEGNYNGANITNNLVVAKKGVKLIANNITKGFIDEVNFTVRLTDLDDNPISGLYVTVHNSVRNFKYKTDADGYVSVPISLRISDTPYVFTSTFAGTSLYESATITNYVIVGKSDVILTASDVEMDYKDGTLYVVRFTDGLGRPINNALINVYNTLGNYRYRTDADGYIYSDKLNFLKPGEYEISAFFTETSVYKGLRIYNNATINKAKTQLSVSNVTMIYGDGSTYDAVLTDINGKPISNGVVKINDTLTAPKYKTNVNGSISAPINVGLGQYVFTAEFIGNALYDSCIATSKVIVNKNQFTLSANDVNMYYRDGTSYLVRFTDDAGNPMSNALISVNNTLGVYKYRTNASGIAVVPLTNLKPGSYVITATYDGDEVACPISISNNVLVKKIKTELSVSEISIDASSGKLRLTDVNGNPIANYAIKVTDTSGLHKYTTNASGFVSIPINTASDQYVFKATFDGNALYDSTSIISNVIISDNAIVLSAADINMYYNDGTNYTVRCTDGEGNPISNVQIKVNNTLGVYKYNTDSNGYVSAPRTNLRPGEYVFTAVFEGNGQYGAVNVTNNVVINKALTKISVFDVDMNYNDGTNYIVKLTDVDENPISGVTVSINNGISTYRYHTDESGMVSVPITLNAGEYTFTASFEGNALYESYTRDSSVVVRG